MTRNSIIEDFLKRSQLPPQPFRDYLGDRLTERRSEARLTQEQLAELVGVSRQTVSFWEQGRSYPTLPHAAKLQEVLDKKLRVVQAREIIRQAAREGIRQDEESRIVQAKEIIKQDARETRERLRQAIRERKRQGRLGK